MDKEWMHLPSRLLPEYAVGVEKFIKQARFYAKMREVILCPCMHCKNKKYKKFDQVYEDLIIKGMDPSYTTWIFHGETSTSQSQGDCSLGVEGDGGENREVYNLFTDAFDPDEEAGHNTNDAEIPLFPGCTAYTKLLASLTLYDHKSTNGQSDKSLNELLEILHDMFPEHNTLPKSVYEMKQLLKPFDLGCEKIHACPNDCCLFKCDWANPGSGIKMEDGFTLVNLHQGLKTFENDPFILASQAKQVFYSKDKDDSNWYVLLKAPPRGIHHIDLLDEDAYTASAPLDVSHLEINVCEKEPYARDGCKGIDVTD